MNFNEIKNRNIIIKRLKPYYFQKSSNELKISLSQSINNSYLNNISSSINKSNYNNKTEINQDIIGYNNYIINGNINPISIHEVPKKNIFHLYNRNNSKISLSNYLQNSKRRNNNKSNIIINNNISNNYSSSLYNNEEIDYMNLKLNFKLIEQKLSHLNNIISSNDNQNSKKANNSTNNISKSSFMKEIPSYKTDTIMYTNNGLNNFIEMKNSESNSKNKNKNNIIKKKLFVNLKNQQKILKIKNNKNYKNKIRINLRKDNNFFHSVEKRNKNENINNNDSININDINDIEILKHKESENLSEIANEIIDIMNDNLDNNKTSNKKIFNKKKIITKNNTDVNNLKKTKNKIIKYNTNNNINRTEYSISNLPQIHYNPSYNKNLNKSLNNNQKTKLIVEHVFDYNHYDNTIKNIIDKEILKKKINYDNDNDDDNNDNNENKDKNFENKNLKQNNIIKVNLKNDNNNNNNDELNKFEKEINDNDNQYLLYEEKINKFLDNINNDDNDKDEDGKIINSLMAQISQQIKDEKEKEKEEKKNKINNNQNKINIKKKKVTFDENLIYINYNQKYKVKNLHITDMDDKTLKFKPKDISKYLKILKSNININKIKPIIINTDKIDYNNIINNINKINKINNISSQRNEKIKRNINFIKVVQKRGNIYKNSMEKNKKAYNSES